MDEANYPSNFNMEEFKNLKSFAARLRYCKENLQPIASGSGRYVFGIDADTVLKLAKNKKGVAQNETEYKFANDSYITIVAEVFDVDENFLWIEMERLNKCTWKKFENITGIDSSDFNLALIYYYYKHLSRNNYFNQKPDTYDEIVENEFFQDVVDLMANYDMPPGDLTKLSSWGITKTGEIKLIDAGLSQQVYDTYYK